MTTCAIFSAASYIEAVCKEIDHLKDEMPAAFAEFGWEASPARELVIEDDYSGLRYGYRYRLSRVYRGQRRPVELVLHFDLFRPTCDTTWVGARRALLVVAYSPIPDDGWECETAAPQDNGQLLDAETRAELTPWLDDRLLVWQRQDESADYTHSAWLFAVPLSDITDLAALRRTVIQPVKELVTATGRPKEALAAAGALQWPKQVA